jgi:phage internal scaffolding protein
MIKPTKVKRLRSVLNTGRGKTEQAHKKECDMNYILKEYAKTGIITHAATHQGQYDDYTEADFQNAMFIITEAKNMFDALPAIVRKRFANNPKEFLSFVQDPANKEEMKALGILKGNDGLNSNGLAVDSPQESKPKKQESEPAIPEDPPGGGS